MAIIKRFTGGDSHSKSAMLVKDTFEADAIGESFETSNAFDFYGGGCPNHLPVFADLTETSQLRAARKNDYLGIFEIKKLLFQNFKIELIDEDCNLIAELNDDTYGEYFPEGSFANNSKYVGYKLEWKNVLQLHGAGVYKIKVSYSNVIAGTVEKCSCGFNLMHYSDEDADNTVKMEFEYNSYYINSTEDFRGEKWKSMFRVYGYFGNPQPQLERSSYLNTNRQITDIQDKMYNEYTFETEFVPHCISELIIPTQENKSLASISDEILITDYNITNHFNFVKLPVLITKIKPIHNSSSRKISYEITCEDRNRKNVKRKVR